MSSIDPETNDVTPLFNPRKQRWEDHFRFEDTSIIGLTPVGRATVRLLQLNSVERLAERRELAKAGRLPTAS